MAEDCVEEMLRRHAQADQPKEKASITLDAETLRLARKWSVGTLKETIAWFVKVADQCLTERKSRRSARGNEQVTT